MKDFKSWDEQEILKKEKEKEMEKLGDYVSKRNRDAVGKMSDVDDSEKVELYSLLKYFGFGKKDWEDKGLVDDIRKIHNFAKSQNAKNPIGVVWTLDKSIGLGALKGERVSKMLRIIDLKTREGALVEELKDLKNPQL